MIDAMLQLSAVIGVPKSTPVAVHPVFAPLFIAAGQIIVGFTLSITITNCEQLAVLPASSVTVQMTKVFPKGNTPGALFVTVATWQLSLTIGVPNNTPTAVQPMLVETVFVAGQFIVGLIVSKTVIN